MEEIIKTIKGSKGYITIFKDGLLGWKGIINLMIDKDFIYSTFPLHKTFAIYPYFKWCKGNAWVRSIYDPDERLGKQIHNIRVDFIGTGKLEVKGIDIDEIINPKKIDGGKNETQRT